MDGQDSFTLSPEISLKLPFVKQRKVWTRTLVRTSGSPQGKRGVPMPEGFEAEGFVPSSQESGKG
jgi:hypothetical protein